MLIQGKSSAARRYKRRGLSVMAGYFAIYLSTFYFANRFHPSGAELFALAALPVLPILAVIFLTGSYLREERDEFRRDLVVRCLLWGTAGSLAVTMFAGFLRIFGWKGNMPPFSEFWAFFVLMMIAKLTYRMANPLPADE